MKKLVISFVLFLLIVAVNTGCISYLEIAKTLPPEIELGENQNTIQFVNFFDVKQLKDVYNEKRYLVYETCLDNLKKGLETSFSEDSNYTLFINDSTFGNAAHNNLPNALSKDSVQYLCSENKVSLLLALESLDFYFDKEIEVSEDEDGKKTKMANYYLVAKAGLSLYNNSGAAVKRLEISDEIFIDSREVIALGVVAIRPSYVKREEEANELFYNIGAGYILKFYPSQMQEIRQYYTNTPFKEIAPYMKSKDWEKSIELLKPYTNSGERKIAGRASHNLSVIYEAIGEQDSANFWMNKAKFLLDQ